MSESNCSEQLEVPDGWLTPWEKKCLDEWEKEMTLEDRTQVETDRCEQKIWQSFQNTASSISQLYKEGAQQSSTQLWVPFQSAAGAATILYKDSQEMMRRSFELGSQLGGYRRNREIIAWLRKRRRHIAREDLVAYMCGRSAAPQQQQQPLSSRLHHRPAQGSSSYVRSAGGRLAGIEPTSPRFLPVSRGGPYYGNDSPDLTVFKDALGFQGFSGAASNLGVSRRSSQTSITGVASHGTGAINSPLRGSPLRSASTMPDDFHSFMVEQFGRNGACGLAGVESRKRAASSDGRGGSDSPSGASKRNRMETDD